MANISIFNNPNLFDIVLNVNGERFYLLSDILEKHTDFFKDMKPTSQSVGSHADMIVSIVTKKVVNIDDPLLKTVSVTSVLKYMYDNALEITTENAMDIYYVSTKFKMNTLSNKCIDCIETNVNIETLLDDYTKNSDPMKNVLGKILKSHLDHYNKDEILKFTEKIPLKDFISFLTFDIEPVVEDKSSPKVLPSRVEPVVEDKSSPKVEHNEEYLYDIAENYCEKNILSDDDRKTIMGSVRLDGLSGEYLVDRVKNNPYIDERRYYNVLEKFAREKKEGKNNKGNKGVFCFGKLEVEYSGYRLVTAKECESQIFKQRFEREYKKNNGLYSLDNFNGDALCNDTHPLCVDSTWWVRLRDQDVKKGSYVLFKHSNGENDSFLKKINTISSHDDKNSRVSKNGAGLFVPHGTRF